MSISSLERCHLSTAARPLHPNARRRVAPCRPRPSGRIPRYIYGCRLASLSAAHSHAYAIPSARRSIPGANRKSSTERLRFLYRPFHLQACIPGTTTTVITQAQQRRIHTAGATLDLGFAVGSARASRNISLFISSIFRLVHRPLFSRIYRWPPTYAHLVWQNADPGFRTRLSLALACRPAIRADTDSLHVRPRSGPSASQQP